MADFLKARIINQVDQKFILISIPRSSGSIVALIDQHAADERYRLETIIKSLPTSIHPTIIDIPFVGNPLDTLSKQRVKLRQWGIDIEITDVGVRILGIPSVLKDVDPGRWKVVLTSFLMMTMEDNCPSGFMDMFCSK